MNPNSRQVERARGTAVPRRTLDEPPVGEFGERTLPFMLLFGVARPSQWFDEL